MQKDFPAMLRNCITCQIRNKFENDTHELLWTIKEREDSMPTLALKASLKYWFSHKPDSQAVLSDIYSLPVGF